MTDLRQWTDMDLVREVWVLDHKIADIIAELERRGLRIRQTFDGERDSVVWKLSRIPGSPL